MILLKIRCIFWDMSKVKLVDLLSGLDDQEWKELDKLVNSSFFNQHAGVQRLMEVLYHHRQENFRQFSDREWLFARVFPGENFSYQKISDLMTYLTRLVETYFIQQELQGDDFQTGYFLLRQLRKRSLNKLFHGKVRQVDRSISRQKTPEDEYHLYLLAGERVTFQSQQKNRSEDDSFSNMAEHLDHFFLINRIKIGCGMLNRGDVHEAQYDLALVKQLVSFIEANPEKYHGAPLISIYASVFRMLENKGNDEYFEKARHQLEMHQDILPDSVMRELYAWLMNFCIYRINNGDGNYSFTLFSLYQYQLERGILLEEGNISPWDYKNIVSLAIRLEKFDWAEEFIEGFRKKLHGQFLPVAYTYNLASLYFARGNYKETLQLLRDLEFEDVYYQTGAKTILLKIYYETGDHEALYYQLDAFEAYIKRTKKVSAYQRVIYLNLISYTRKLANLRIKLDTTYRIVKPEKILKLKSSILRTKNVAQLKWLTAQADKLFSAHKIS